MKVAASDQANWSGTAGANTKPPQVGDSGGSSGGFMSGLGKGLSSAFGGIGGRALSRASAPRQATGPSPTQQPRPQLPVHAFMSHLGNMSAQQQHMNESQPYMQMIRGYNQQFGLGKFEPQKPLQMQHGGSGFGGQGMDFSQLGQQASGQPAEMSTGGGEGGGGFGVGDALGAYNVYSAGKTLGSMARTGKFVGGKVMPFLPYAMEAGQWAMGMAPTDHEFTNSTSYDTSKGLWEGVAKPMMAASEAPIRSNWRLAKAMNPISPLYHAARSQLGYAPESSESLWTNLGRMAGQKWNNRGTTDQRSDRYVANNQTAVNEMRSQSPGASDLWYAGPDGKMLPTKKWFQSGNTPDDVAQRERVTRQLGLPSGWSPAQ